MFASLSLSMIIIIEYRKNIDRVFIEKISTLKVISIYITF